MNSISPQFFSPEVMRKSAVYSILDDVCRDLELTDAQLTAAKSSYEPVAEWLATSEVPLLRNIRVYPHGSAALGTSVKPLGREDFDVDVICLVLGYASHWSPAQLKSLVGDRLKQHGRYARMLQEKKRCWRLDYACEFHLDISPTIVNPNCALGGELVPDKKLRDWHPTNPSGYRDLFDRRAALVPQLRSRKSVFNNDQAGVAPFPTAPTGKGVLRRTVQLLKRHRDIHFEHVVEEVAPISIVITTLAARAYEFAVGLLAFDTELDVVLGTIRLMPRFVERRLLDGRHQWWVPNETTNGENFADRWNSQPARVEAFYAWHAKALSDFERVASLEGLDAISRSLEECLGGPVVRGVMNKRTASITTARSAGQLAVAATGGVSLSRSASATPVPPNTHFGD